VCGPDDDLSPGVGNADFAARVSLVGELPHEELGQLGVEDTIGDGLSALADDLVAGHLEGGWCIDTRVCNQLCRCRCRRWAAAAGFEGKESRFLREAASGLSLPCELMGGQKGTVIGTVLCSHLLHSQTQ